MLTQLQSSDRHVSAHLPRASGARLKRRQIAALAAAAVFAQPIRLLAQRSGTARLGILHPTNRDATVDAMVMRLGQFGWVEGRSLDIEFRVFWELEQSAAYAKELARLKPDVILALSTPAALAVKANAPATPMVFFSEGDPVGLGLVASLARPGGNATGYVQRLQQSALAQFWLLRELAPTALRIAVIYGTDNPSVLQGVLALQAAASGLGVAVEGLPLYEWMDIDAAGKKLKREPVDGLLVLGDRITSRNSGAIVGLAHDLRLPAVYGSRQFVDSAGAISYGIDWGALVVHSADYVARILGGAQPGDLPVLPVGQFDLVVNLVSAEFQGLRIPESVLLRATEVIR